MAAGPAGSTSSRLCWWRSVDIWRWSPSYGGRVGVGWSAHPCRIPADERQIRGARPPRTTHDSSTKIHYRFHAFYGAEVEVIRHLRRTDSAILIVRLPGGTQIAVPEWMLLPQVCDRLVIEAEPRISIAALIELRALIDAQSLKNTSKEDCCAESPSGGQDAQQRKSHQLAAPAALRGRRDLDEASRTGAGTVPNLVASSPGKRRQSR